MSAHGAGPHPDGLTTEQMYQKDFVTWAEQQAEALRRSQQSGSNIPVDWDNIASEIDGLGHRERIDLETLVHRILFYLLKVATSPSNKARPHWMDEIDEFRDQLHRILKRNGSLEPLIPALVEAEWPSAIKRVERQLRRYGEFDQAAPALIAWKRYKMKPDDVLKDGMFPIRGITTMGADAE